MAVFDNLRNFIRQGKQASAKNTPASRSTASSTESPNAAATKSRLSASSSKTKTGASSEVPDDILEHQQKYEHQHNGSNSEHGSDSQAAKHPNGEAHAAASPAKKGKVHKYDNAVKRIIAEDNESRSKMPSYPGLERYRLMEKMGDGAFSVVYRAEDLETREPRAIKVVSRQNLTPSQRASVLKEAAIMRQLNHDSIVQMHAFLETPEHYFIVLELVDGGELFHQIVHLTYFSEDLSRHVIIQVANAVRYLHEEAGVVHRDIKPENLLFTRIPHVPSKQRTLRPGDDDTKEDEGEFELGVGGGGVGTIKLADFGLSKIIWDSKTMTPCGTVGYTAPEIVKDEKYSKSVDMWALGCVLYTILCGFPPFYDESIEMLTHKVAMGQYTFLSPWWDGISDSAKDLVSRLLTVDPEKRYTIDEFLQHPWITQGDVATLPSNSEVAAHMYPSVPSTPLHERSGVRDVARSGALKDAFDVSNAVYRLEQEMARRNQKARNAAAIIEEGDEDADFAHIEHAFDRLSVSNSRSTPGSASHSGGGMNGLAPTSASQRTSRHASPSVGSTRAAAKRAAAAGGPSQFFDLHLEGSTLLERRKARQAPLAH